MTVDTMTDFNRHIRRIALLAGALLFAIPAMLGAQVDPKNPVDPVNPVDRGRGADTLRGPDTLRTIRTIDTLRSFDTVRVENWRAGLYLGINRNIYGANDMQGLPGVPTCCPGFDNGGGFGVAIGGMVETPIDGALSVGARLYVNTYDGSLVHNEEILLDQGGEPVNGVIEHRIDASIMSLAIEPILSFGVTESARLFGGLRGDIIVKKTFDQQERIIEPSDLIFVENGTATRLEFTGNIPDAASFYGTFVGGLRYDIMIDDKNWAIAPELSFYYSPTPVVRSETWNIYGLRFAFVAQKIEWENVDRAEMSDFIPPPLGPPISIRVEEMTVPTGAAGVDAAETEEEEPEGPTRSFDIDEPTGEKR